MQGEMSGFEAVIEELGIEDQGDRAFTDCPVCSYRPGCLGIYRDEAAPRGFKVHCRGAGCHPAPILRALGLNGVPPAAVPDASTKPRAAMTPDERRAALTQQQLELRRRKDTQHERAYNLWHTAPLYPDDEAVRVGKDYLLSRGLNWDDALAPVIRFARLHHKMHQFNWFKIKGANTATFFVIMAQFTDLYTNKFAGLHVTFIAPFQGKVARRTIGLISQGAVKLSGPETPSKLAIGEGLETCLSARQLGWGKSIWMLGSSEAIGKFPLLTPVKELHIIREHDDANLDNAKEVGGVYRRGRRKVKFLKPLDPAHNDANDVLRALIKKGVHHG